MWLTFLLLMAVGLSEATYEHFRLPNAIVPQKYNLRILTHLEDTENFHFNGTVEIDLLVVAATKNVTFHAKDLLIDESKTTLIDLSTDRLICILKTETNPIYSYYILHVCETLVAQTTYKLKIDFSAKLGQLYTGYFINSYKVAATNSTRYLTATQFEPMYARTAFPCFDEPVYKAKFTIALGHHEQFQALSNMPVKQIRRSNDLKGYVWTEFEETVLMSTYLVAYSVNDFIHKTFKSPNISTELRVFARPEVMDEVNFVFDLAVDTIQYWENLFGLKYPLPKMDLIAMPQLGLAMENWGLIIFGERMFLISNNSVASDKQLVAQFVTHEIVHQWFGNLVTMEWWNDLWLKESVSSYMEHFFVDFKFPKWKWGQQSISTAYTFIFSRHAFNESKAIARNIDRVSVFSDLFNEIVYDKGMITIHLLHNFIGREAFIDGLVMYLKRHAYHNAKRDDLWNSMSKAAHNRRVFEADLSIKTIMDSWILQPGYPVVNVRRNYAKQTVEIEQQHYFNDRKLIPKSTACWWIPLSYTTANVLNFNPKVPQIWLKCPKTNVTLKNAPDDKTWLLFNVQMSALYRVNYDRLNWQLLIQSLTRGNVEDIHQLNRVQLISDVFNLAYNGWQSYDIAFDLIAYLKNEKEYLPWREASNELARFENAVVKLKKDENYQKFMRIIWTPLYRQVGGMRDNYKKLKEEREVSLKSLAVSRACSYSVDDCVETVMKYFALWRQEIDPDRVRTVPTELRELVYYTAIRYGDDIDWEFLWQRFEKSNTEVEQSLLLSALTATKNLTRLEYLLKKPHLKSLYVSVFAAASTNEDHLGFAQNFFIDNLSFMWDNYEHYLSMLIKLAFSSAKTKEDYEKLQKFYKANESKLNKYKVDITQSFDLMRLKLRWVSERYDEMMKAVIKYITVN